MKKNYLIINITLLIKHLIFLMFYQNVNFIYNNNRYAKELPDYVLADEVNKECPETVIKFYEDHVNRNSLRIVNLNDVENL